MYVYTGPIFACKTILIEGRRRVELTHPELYNSSGEEEWCIGDAGIGWLTTNEYPECVVDYYEVMDINDKGIFGYRLDTYGDEPIDIPKEFVTHLLSDYEIGEILDATQEFYTSNGAIQCLERAYGKENIKFGWGTVIIEIGE